MPTPPQSPAAPQAPAMTQVVPVEVLQSQLADLSQQLAGVVAQRNVLNRQVAETPPGALRNQLEAQRDALSGQAVQLEMQVASARAQIASRWGVPADRVGPTGRIVIPSNPPFFPRRGPDPDVIVGMSFTLVIAVAFPLAIAYARRIWRGKPAAAAGAQTSDTVAPRLDRLEQAVDAIAIEIERVAEGQRFVTKVLAERPAMTAQPQAAPADPIMRDGSAGLGEAKPFLALGAGPMEPIRAAERQAVRPSITPH